MNDDAETIARLTEQVDVLRRLVADDRATAKAMREERDALRCVCRAALEWERGQCGSGDRLLNALHEYKGHIACAPGKGVPTVTKPYPTTKNYRQDEVDRITDGLCNQLLEAQRRGVAGDQTIADLRCQRDVAQAEVARLTPVWTDGPPDRVGPWLRETNGVISAVNVHEKYLGVRYGGRWLWLGDLFEKGRDHV